MADWTPSPVNHCIPTTESRFTGSAQYAFVLTISIRNKYFETELVVGLSIIHRAKFVV